MTAKTDDQFVKTVRKFLDNNQPREALEVFEKNGCDEILSNSASELIPTIATHLSHVNSVSNGNLFEICIKMLEIFAKTCDPPDIVLLLCEQVETLEDDVRFRSLLGPLIVSLRRGDLLQSIDYFTISTRAYLEDLPLPDNRNPQLEDSNDDQDDCNDNCESIVERLTTTHKLIVSHMEPLTYDVSKNVNVEPKILYNLLNLQLNLFGKPFSHLIIETNEEKQSSFHSGVRQILELECDPFRFLKIVGNRPNENEKNLYAESEDPDRFCDLEMRYLNLEVPNLAYANFFFTLMVTSSLRCEVPQVYHPQYVTNSCSHLANYLLTQSDYVLVSKGLQFVGTLIHNIKKESIKHEALKSTIHIDILSSLSQIMIYCESVKERQHALKIFQDYIYLFNMTARYLLIRHLYETKQHSGLRALLINILKTSIIESLDDPSQNTHFLGNKLKSILKSICKFPQLPKSNLIETSDEIASALNLLRFLFIRDKINVTGIWDLIKSLEKDYLKPLREEIDITRRYWKFEVRDFETQIQERAISKNADKDPLTVTVGAMTLPDIPVDEKIKICNQALITLDVIESLLIRVHECMENDPRKK